MKIQLCLVGITCGLIWSAVNNAISPAILTAGSVVPIAYSLGENKPKKNTRDAFLLGLRQGSESNNDNCQTLLDHQKARLTSEFNQQLIAGINRAIEDTEATAVKKYQPAIDLVAKLRAELDQLQSEAQKNDRRWQAKFDRELDLHRLEISNIQAVHAGEIERLNDRLSQLEKIATEYDRRKSEIKRAEDRITEYRANEKVIRLEIRHLTEDLNNYKRTIATLQNELQSMRTAAIQQFDEGLKQGFSQGQATAIDVTKRELELRGLEIERLNTKIERLELQLRGKADRDKFDRSLPELSDILSQTMKPIAVEGSQGSGKALAIANAINCYSKGKPAIVLVLDISEADDPDSSWRRLGIPCTGDPLVFGDFLEAAAAALPTRPHRNDRTAYDASPCVFAVIDEALCAFSDLDKETIESRIRTPLKALESRGAKRKVFPVVATQNAQIQNLKANGVVLWNSGTLGNYYKILMNDALRESVSHEEIERDPDLGKFIEVFDGKFIAAVETVTGRGKRKQPIKHPSHHGQNLTDTVPNRGVETIPIAPVPNWLPSSCRKAYCEFAPSDRPGDRPGDTDIKPVDIASSVTTPETSERKGFDVLTDSRSPAQLAARHGLTTEDILILIDGIDEGQSMTAALSKVATKSSRPNSKWQKLRSAFLELSSR